MGILPKPDPVWCRGMARLKLVFLDYDLTLMDTMIDFYEAVNRARERYGLKPLDYEAFLRYFIEDTLDRMAPPPEDPIGFWRYFRRVYETRYGKPMDGAWYLLYILKLRGCRNIIVTGREKPSTTIWGELRRFGLEWGIDEVYTMHDLEVMGGSEDCLFDKSWLLRVLLDKHGAEPGEAVMIGDYRLDAESAGKAGILFIGLSSIRPRAESLYSAGACRVVSSLYEVPLVIYDVFHRGECPRE